MLPLVETWYRPEEYALPSVNCTQKLPDFSVRLTKCNLQPLARYFQKFTC
jgi:hypothetical protein